MKGSIQKRLGKDGKTSYLVRVEMPGVRPGERKQRAKTFPTKREAEAALAKWLVEIDRGTAVEPSRMTVADLATKWLDTVAAHRVKPTTLNTYRSTIEKHIVPYLGNVLAQRLTADTISAFYAARLKAGASPRIVRQCHLRLSQIMQQGEKWGLVYRNPCSLVEPPRTVYQRGATWSPEEAQRFLAAAESDIYSPLWLLLLSTGLRRGEALGLRWRDFNPDERLIRVSQSVVLLGDTPIVQEPKTSAGRRSVKLPPEVIAALQAHRIKQLTHIMAHRDNYDDHDLVFARPDGKPIHPHRLYKHFRAIIERAGVPRIRIHDLRHTHATLLLLSGQPVHVVSERLGHASTSITMDTYAHVLPDMQDRAVDAIGGLLFRKPA